MNRRIRSILLATVMALTGASLVTSIGDASTSGLSIDIGSYEQAVLVHVAILLACVWLWQRGHAELLPRRASQSEHYPLRTAVRAAHRRRIAVWGAVAFGAAGLCVLGAHLSMVAMLASWAQLLVGLLAVGCIALTFLSTVKTLYHALRYVQLRGQ